MANNSSEKKQEKLASPSSSKSKSFGLFKLNLLRDMDTSKQELVLKEESPELLRQFLEDTPIFFEKLSAASAVALASKIPDLKRINFDGCTDLIDEDVEKLVERCPKIETLRIGNSIHVTDASLQAISRLKFLKHLEIKNLERITNFGLNCLQNNTELLSLTLKGIDRLSNDGLAFLQSMPVLQKLSITECSNLSDEGLKYLDKLKSLFSLDLSWTPIEGKGFSYFKNLHALQQLNLSNCKLLKEDELHHLQPLQNLIGMDLTHCLSLTTSNLKNLLQIKGLLALKLGWCDLKNTQIKSIAEQLPKLMHLNIQGASHLTAETFQALTQLSQLERLDLSATDVNDAILEPIADLKKLEELYLNDCLNISDEGLKLLQNNKELTVLVLKNCPKITDAGLAPLANLPQLVSLDLSDCPKITSSGLSLLAPLEKLAILKLHACSEIVSLSPLKNLPQLTGLDLFLTGINDASLKAIQHLPLTWLNISGCDISDAGLCEIGLLKDLTSLNLTGCHRINDAGLGCLSTLKELYFLDLSDCPRITYAGLEGLPWEGKLTHLIKPEHLYYGENPIGVF